MAKRVHENTGHAILRKNGWRTSHCGPIALAHAIANEPDDLLEVAECAAVVRAVLFWPGRGRRCPAGKVDRVGTMWGGVDAACERIGLTIRAIWTFGAGYRTRGRASNLPTVASAVAGMKRGQRALIRSTAHVGYVRHTGRRIVCYNLKPRSRVDTILILEGSTDLNPRSLAPAIWSAATKKEIT